MPTYDLLAEPWIPVLDGSADLRPDPHAPLVPRLVGLREALLRAHEIREVAGGSPLETLALDRLLLALAIDVFLPAPDVGAWTSLWRAGRLPAAPLDAYLDAHRDRFDLLHAAHPFFQRATPDASQDGKPPAPLSTLFLGRASGNNATLFAHDVDSRPGRMPLADAARGLVATQASALGGGASQPFYFSHAPLVGRAQFWIRGRSLFEALLLNGPPDARARMGDLGRDAPVWRRPDPAAYTRRPHLGLRDVLAWPARRVTLATETDAAGATVAVGVYLTQGDKLEPQPSVDPLAAHVVSRDVGTYPLGFRAGRALWRDAAALFRSAGADGAGPPFTFEWLASGALFAAAGDAADLRTVFRETGVDAFGLVNDQAKAELWRHERLPLHVALLQDRTRQQAVEDALARARTQWDDKARGLRRAVRTTAEYALSPPPPGTDAAPSADPRAVSLLAESLAAEPRFWAALETPFFALLARVADAETEADRAAAAADWDGDVFSAARLAFDAATAHFDGDARHLRATAQGRARLQPVAPAAPPPPEPAAGITAPDSQPSLFGSL